MKHELKNVTLKFDNTLLFENLNLTFESPGVIGFLGPSGCGKSTLIRLLARLQKPTSGEILGGSKNQGFVFQESHLLGWRNCFENVALPMELQHAKQDLQTTVQSLLKSVGLEKAAQLYPAQLSGGMKMRASVARAFVSNPEVLYCDEPFSALDEITRENLQTYLRQKIDSQKSLCYFVTHSLSEALMVSDLIYIFRGPGKLDPNPMRVSRTDLNEFRNSSSFQEQLLRLRADVRGSFS